MKEGKFQHSKTEILSRVVMAVRLRDGVVILESVGAGHVMELERERPVAKRLIDNNTSNRFGKYLIAFEVMGAREKVRCNTYTN